MTATEAAELLGVHINTISKYLKEKKLRYKRISIRKVDIDPDSVFEIMPPERKVELQERIKIDLNKAKYREYMKKYVKEYDKQEWRKENKNRNKTETVITEDGKVVKRSLRGFQDESLGQRLRMIAELETYIGEEGLAHLTFQQLCKLYGFKELAEKYAKLKYEDSKAAIETGQLAQPPIYLLKHKVQEQLIESIKKLEKYRSMRFKFNRKYETPEELAKKIEEYFTKNKTKIYREYNHKWGKFIEVERPVVWNKYGLANHLGITPSQLEKYATDENYKDFHPVMEWAFAVMNDRMINSGSHEVTSPRFTEFLLKNFKNEPFKYADKVDIDRKDVKHTKVQVELILGNQPKQIEGNEIKQIENESMKNKESIGIDMKKIIDAYNKQQHESHETITIGAKEIKKEEK